jgi:endonuclease/exonuclease/phosphatase (EEP) superfamily protein YafD
VLAIAARLFAWAAAIVLLAIALAGRFPPDNASQLGHYANLASSFQAQALLAAMLLGLAASVARFWGAAVVFAMCLIVAAGLLFSVPRQAGGSAGPGDTTLRVLHWNTQHSNRDALALFALIDETDPDIAFFVEPFVGLHALLANDERIANAYPYRVTPRNIGQGMRVIISKHPLSPAWGETLPELARGPIPVIATIEGARVGLAVLHPSSPRTPDTAKSGRVMLVSEASALAETFNADLPLIVAADLNGGPASSRARLLHDITALRPSKRRLSLAGTWPMATPRALRVPIDDVWTRGPFRVIDRRVIETPSSDHAAVVVDLVFAPADAGTAGERAR